MAYLSLIVQSIPASHIARDLMVKPTVCSILLGTMLATAFYLEVQVIFLADF